MTRTAKILVIVAVCAVAAAVGVTTTPAWAWNPGPSNASWRCILRPVPLFTWGNCTEGKRVRAAYLRMPKHWEKRWQGKTSYRVAWNSFFLDAGRGERFYYCEGGDIDGTCDEYVGRGTFVRHVFEWQPNAEGTKSKCERLTCTRG
jgi:hypothetical protein